MSATGRGAVRAPNDFYETPAWCVRAIAPYLPKGRVLDPCSGRGAIFSALGRKNMRGLEIDATTAKQDTSGAKVAIADALDPKTKWPACDVIVTNPPYTLAFDFAQRAVAMDLPVFFLLRLNWLASVKRAQWLREHTPSVYVLPRRPSFRSDGKTDATDYAWMMWDQWMQVASVEILEVP